MIFLSVNPFKDDFDFFILCIKVFDQFLSKLSYLDNQMIKL